MTKPNKVLIIIDPQLDFLEGGSLALNGAKGIMDDLTRYVEKYGNDYSTIIMSCDNHPLNHCSFETVRDENGNGGSLPPHCIQYSVGAAFYKPLMDAIINIAVKHNIQLNILPKGMVDWKEETSITDNVENSTILINALNDATQIDIVGIDGYCAVTASILGLIEFGHQDKINVLEEFCPSLDDGSALHNIVIEYGLSK